MATPTEIAGRYRLDGRLGAGGMSTVFKGTDTVLERPVAVKLLAEHLADDDAFVARFRREALAAARLQHPNIVQVFDSGHDPDSGRHYIVMEYVDGPSCADTMRDNGRLEIEEAVSIVRDACHGLDYAHQAGVIHRDVKPGNLLIASETGAAKLADFGIAKAAEQTRITQVGSVLGTAAYLSPEQARGEEAGPASDIYSLGVCAYQFLTGKLPHEYSSLTELALKQQNDEVEPIRDFRPEVPRELDDAIRVCLRRDPAARYASAIEMALAAEAGLRGEATQATQMLGSEGWQEDATQALPATRATRVAPGGYYTPEPAAPMAAPPERQRKQRATSAQLLARIALALAVILAIVVAVLIVTNGGSGPVQTPHESSVHDQVDALRQIIENHTR